MGGSVDVGFWLCPCPHDTDTHSSHCFCLARFASTLIEGFFMQAWMLTLIDMSPSQLMGQASAFLYDSGFGGFIAAIFVIRIFSALIRSFGPDL